MPIHTMNYENRVFFAKPVGYVDNVDARLWIKALTNHADKSDVPIMGIVDLSQADQLCPTNAKLIARTIAEHTNLLGVAFVTSEMMASRNDRVVSKLGKVSGVRIFNTLSEAQSYAENSMTSSFGAFASCRAASYVFAVAAV